MTENNYSNSFLSTENLADGLRLAREACGKSIKESSQLLNIPASRLRNYENGKYTPSLPEIEILSFLYNVPLSALIDPKLIAERVHKPDAEQLKQLLEIRLQVIATRLKLARERSGKSYKELSRETSVSTSRIKKYEKGEAGIALDELIRITEALDLDPEDLLDKDSPIGQWQASQTRAQTFKNLPPEVQSFALEEDNQPFIKITQKMKAAGIENLARLSDSIQKIVDSSNQPN